MSQPLPLSSLEVQILDLLYRMREVKDKKLPSLSAKESLIDLGLVCSTKGKNCLTPDGVAYVEAYLRKDSLRI